jgi:hypothetical protein
MSLRFAPLNDAVVADHEARLQRIAATIFYDDGLTQLELDPTIGRVHLGMYLDSRRFPPALRKHKPHAQATQTLAMKFLLAVDGRPLTITAAPSRHDAGDLDYLVEAWAPSDDALLVPLLHLSQLTDFSEDNAAELAASGLPRRWVEAFAGMTTETRRVWKRPVDAIRDMPPGLDGLKPARYARMLASYGTYRWLDGAYFPKWQPGKELKGPTPATFTDQFLAATTDEVLLAQGTDYLLVASATSYQLFAIDAVSGGWRAREVLGGYGTAHGDLDLREPRTVVLFHAIDGRPKQKERVHQVYVPAKPRGGYRLLLDPRGMVEDIATPNGASLLNLNDSFDWFVQMTTLYFPDPFAVVDLSSWTGLVESASYQMLKRELDATVRYVMDGGPALGDFAAELTAARRARVEELLARPGVLVFTQGMPVGASSRIVGADERWVYFRDLVDGSVFALHLLDFVRDWRLAVISDDVYQSTRGVMPLVGLLFAAAAIALAAPVVLPAAEVWAVRTVVRELTVREMTTMAAKRVAKFLAPALAAELTVLVLDLFERAGGASDASRRWKAFAEGFFHGYLVHTLRDEFFRKFTIDKLPGPKEYRAAMMVKRAYQLVDKVHGVVTTLETELDDRAVRRGLRLFEEAMTRSVKGSLLLLSLLYYLSGEDLGVMLDAYAGKKDAAPPEDAIWHYESAQQISKMARTLLDTVKGATNGLHGLVDALEGTKPYAVGAAVLFTSDAGILVGEVAKAMGRATVRQWDKRPEAMKKVEAKVKAAITHPTVLKVLAGVVVASGVVDHLFNDGKGRGAAVAPLAEVYDVALKPLLDELTTQWPGSTPTRAKIHGELTGGLLGAFMFNRFLFGNDDEVAAAKKADHPHLGQRWITFVNQPWGGAYAKKKLKVGFIGPLLMMILKRYVSLFEQVRRHGHFQDREHTLETMGRLLSVGEDAALSEARLERLAKFRTREETVSFSLAELVKILFRLRTTIGKDLRDYLAERQTAEGLSVMDFLPVEVERLATAAETLGLPELVETYARELYVVVSMHFVMALNELEAALDALFEPFSRNEQGWMELLHELGFDVGDLGAVIREFDQAQKDRLSAFDAAGGL